MAELDIRPSSTIVICGKRNEGKSVLAKWLLYNLVQQQKVDIVYLFSTTEHLSHSFDCVPKEFVIPTFDIPFMEKIISSQEKEIIKMAQGKDDPNIKQILFIFDDMLGSVKQGSNEQLALNRFLPRADTVKIPLWSFPKPQRGCSRQHYAKIPITCFSEKIMTTNCRPFSKVCTGPARTNHSFNFTIGVRPVVNLAFSLTTT